MEIKSDLDDSGILSDRNSTRLSDYYNDCSSVVNIKSWHKRLKSIDKNESSRELTAQIYSHCFELEVIHKLHLFSSVSTIIYEPPPINKHGKNCDLKVCSSYGDCLIEIKTFWPERRPRTVDSNYFPKNFTVDLDPESYHDDFAIRSQLIQQTLETERKFSNYESNYKTVLVAPTGYYLSWLDYSNFVYIYQTRRSSLYDYLGKLTIHHLNSEQISFNNNINEFWHCRYSNNKIESISLVESGHPENHPIQLAL